MSDRTHPDSGPVTPGEACFSAADMATAAAQGFRDGVASVSAQAADRAIENCPELNMGNYDAVGVERLNDWAIRAHDEIDRLHALAAGQATAAPAQPVAQQGVAYAAQQASTVTNYTTLGAAMRAIRQSIQMIGDPEDECMRAVKRVLRGAVIIVEDSGDEVAAPAAPAQPDPAYSAACHLATALFKKYFAHLPDFASGQAVWGLCGSTAGVISQIDNMVSGLLQPPTTAFSEDEPQ